MRLYSDQRLVYISELLKSLIKHYYNNDNYLLKAADCVVFLMKGHPVETYFYSSFAGVNPPLDSLLKGRNSETLVCLEILCKQCSTSP